MKQLFFSDSSDAVYGSRLDGMEKVKITHDDKKAIISSLESDSSVSKCEYDLQGKIVNITLTINDDVGIDTAKSVANKVLENLSDEQKKFYDVQVFIKKNKGANDFPIIGYKQNAKEGFSWTKDRAAS